MIAWHFKLKTFLEGSRLKEITIAKVLKSSKTKETASQAFAKYFCILQCKNILKCKNISQLTLSLLSSPKRKTLASKRGLFGDVFCEAIQVYLIVNIVKDEICRLLLVKERMKKRKSSTDLRWLNVNMVSVFLCRKEGEKKCRNSGRS